MVKVTIGTTEYDAFETVAGADLYLAADVARATGWALRNDDAKARGLVSATRVLLGQTWCAAPADPAGDPPPAVVMQVTAELAADLLTNPSLLSDASGNSNVKSAKAGSAQVEFFPPVDDRPPLPKAMWDRLLAAGILCGPGAGDLDVTLDGAQPFGTCGGPTVYTGRSPLEWLLASEGSD